MRRRYSFHARPVSPRRPVSRPIEGRSPDSPLGGRGTSRVRRTGGDSARRLLQTVDEDAPVRVIEGTLIAQRIARESLKP